MTPDELIAELEKAFVLRPESPTASIIVDVLDSFRKEIDARLLGQRALSRAMLQESEEAYRYAIARYKDVGGGYKQVIGDNNHRFTEPELRLFAAKHGLDYTRLWQVATGARASYKGWEQGPFLRFTFGRQYRIIDPDDVPAVPQQTKVGAMGLFRSARRQRNDDD